MHKYENIKSYIDEASPKHKKILIEIQKIIKKNIPRGKETIAYGMPTIKLYNRNFIHYAAMKGHLGFYPSPSGVNVYKKELEDLGISYSKGCIRFSYDKELPISLITKIIKYRIKEEKNNNID